MLQPIVSFQTDEQGEWTAELACGHSQHVRHDPPWQVRAWVAEEAGRAGKLGSELECKYCDMAMVPLDTQPYKRTATFTHEDVPAGLRADHRTKEGVWARIVVEHGKLEYVCARGTFVLRPGIIGVVEPASLHSVRPLGEVAFYVEFMR